MSTAQGRYRIQSVAELTGVPSTTLRAWERRYGVPSPTRTEAAYRLYSERDVALVKRMRELCEEGIAPAEAARLAQATPPDGRAIDADTRATTQLQERLLRAVETFDASDLEASCRLLLSVCSLSHALGQVVVPVLREVGQRWHDGKLSVAQEHLASEVLGNLCRDILRLAQPDSRQRVLLACYPQEDHVLPLYIVGFTFAQLGYRSVVLGQRVPTAELGRAVVATQPALVALSSTTTLPRATFHEATRNYAKACGSRRWMVGGKGAMAHQETIEGLGGIVAPSGLDQLERLIRVT